MLKRTLLDSSMGTAGNPSNIRLENVQPLWLHISDTDKFLLLEDLETGDVLMPLIYMKEILEANYSRKLASLKYRQVRVPRKGALSQQEGLVYWQWAFESPHNVKLIVRKELGESNTPQGHLRLVLLPIVYNALVDRHRDVPEKGKLLFQAIHFALRQSTYWPLVRMPSLDVMERLNSIEATMMHANGGEPLPPIFAGPRSLEATALKYMFMFRDQEELDQSKKLRTTGATPEGPTLATAVGQQTLQALLTGPPTAGGGPSMPNTQQDNSQATNTTSNPLGGSESQPVLQGEPGMTPELMAALLQKRGAAASNLGATGRMDSVLSQAIKSAVDSHMREVVDELSVLKASVVQMYAAAHHFALHAGIHENMTGGGGTTGTAAGAPLAATTDGIGGGAAKMMNLHNGTVAAGAVHNHH